MCVRHWSLLAAALLAAPGPAAARTICPKGFANVELPETEWDAGGCYWLSEEKANFTRCQRDVCGPMNGTLASIHNTTPNNALVGLVLKSGEPAYIGLFERGEDESGDWTWVDGSNFSFAGWHQGEPNNWCLDEDCGAVGIDAFSGWFDYSCAAQFRCLCQMGGSVSQDFVYKEANMTNTTVESSYDRCFEKRVHCWWYRNNALRIAFLLVAVPCALLLASVIARSILTSFLFRRRRRRREGETPEVLEPSIYGQLLDPADAAAGADDIVHRWVLRAAWGAIFYAVALTCLAFTTMLHMNFGISFGFGVDALEAFLMALCKLMVGMCALAVHKHLSPLARSVASCWVFAVAVSELAMAAGALSLSTMYLVVALGGHAQSNGCFCLAGNEVMWTLVMSQVFEYTAGFALAQIQDKAAKHMGDATAITKVVGCSWAMLVGGTFGTGMCLGGTVALFVFDNEHDHFVPVQGVAAFYHLGALCHFVAGAGIMRANTQVQAYFGPKDGARTLRTVEMRETGGASAN